MKTIYKVHRPYRGVYADAETQQELIEALASEAWNSYLELCHGQPFVKVELREDGSQVWKNMHNEELMGVSEEVRQMLINSAETGYAPFIELHKES